MIKPLLNQEQRAILAQTDSQYRANLLLYLAMLKSRRGELREPYIHALLVNYVNFIKRLKVALGGHDRTHT